MSDQPKNPSEGEDPRYPRAPIERKRVRPTPRRQRPEHPENDLADDADYANLQPPAPRNPDELADQVDPAVLAERNQRSSRQAWRYLFVALIGSLLFALLLAVIFRFVAGADTCAAVDGRFLCTLTLQRTWAVVVSVPPIAFLIGAMIIMMRKLRAYVRWRPWMGVFWVLVPFTMWVITITVQVWLSQGPAF